MSKSSELTHQAWLDPPSSYRSAPFWAWNDVLTPEKLHRQIEQLHQAGMGGFFMHSRFGLKTAYLSEEWFRCVAACVEKARQLGMKAYLYDEDRWPSGAAGGLVTRGRAALALKVLAVVKDRQPPAQLERIGSFAVQLNAAGEVLGYRALEDGQGARQGESLLCFAVGASEPSAWFNDAAYLDTLNADAVAEFIRLTHQAYADRFGKDFGGVIPAIFTDEPNYGHGRIQAEGRVALLPWTAELPLEFRNRRGYDLRDHLVELVYALAGRPFSRVRHDYYRTVTELFVENFSAQIGRWCARHGIALTGHYLCEESFASQIDQIGAAMPHYEHQQWPGIDILCDQIDQVSTAKQCTSVAAQLGRPRVVSELYGCTGWDWPLEGHKFNAGWQYALGVNFRCPHLSWYSLAGGGKRDYPASIFPHSPWWRYYRTVEDHFARLSLALTQGRPVRDVLMLHPIESAWGLYLRGRADSVAGLNRPFDALLRLLLEQHYDYDLADESLLGKHGKVSPGGELSLGQMSYRLVIVPPSVTLRAGTAAILKRLLAAGGAVVFVGLAPERIDGEPSDAMAGLVASTVRCGPEPAAVIPVLEGLLPRRVSVTEEGGEARCVWTMLRALPGGGQLLFAQSIDRQAAHAVTVSAQGRRPVVLWDAATGRRTRLPARAVADRVEFDLQLPPTGSVLLSLGVRVNGAEPASPTPEVVARAEAGPPWKIELTEPNVLPLDTCRYRLADGAFSQPVPVLLADEKIRAHYGLPARGAGGNQPWYLAATGRADRAPRDRWEMAFSFHVTDLPGRLHAAIERPEDFQILLNGQPIANRPDGCWVGDEERTVELTPAVRTGRNELLLRFVYRSDMELEDLHLVGPFGVRQTGPRRLPEAYTLTPQPAELRSGSWVSQGLDFYSAGVNYRVALGEQVLQAVRSGKRVRLALPDVKCTCAAVHVAGRTFVLPWAPMSADITDALAARASSPVAQVAQASSPVTELVVEVIGGRHNSLGPLHVPWLPWTGPAEFSPHHEKWQEEYLLNDHGLMRPPVFEIML